MTVFHAKTLGYSAKLYKTKTFVKMQSVIFCLGKK